MKSINPKEMTEENTILDCSHKIKFENIYNNRQRIICLLCGAKGILRTYSSNDIIKDNPFIGESREVFINDEKDERDFTC